MRESTHKLKALDLLVNNILQLELIFFVTEPNTWAKRVRMMSFCEGVCWLWEVYPE